MRRRVRPGSATLVCVCLIGIAGAIASATTNATVPPELVPPTERGPYNVGTTLFTATMSGGASPAYRRSTRRARRPIPRRYIPS
jgi:hypothetical protein